MEKKLAAATHFDHRTMSLCLLRRSAGALCSRRPCSEFCRSTHLSNISASGARRLLCTGANGGGADGPPSDAGKPEVPSVLFACGGMAGAVALSNYLVQFPVGWIGTWGTAVFPVCFLITDLTNRYHGAAAARRVVWAGFAAGVPISFVLLPDEPRIAAASGAAFLLSQLLDVRIFDALRGHRLWWVPPLCSSVIGAAVDSALFGTIAFLGVGMPTERWPLLGELPHWVTWAVGDFCVKSTVAVLNLLPFRFARLAQKVRRP